MMALVVQDDDAVGAPVPAPRAAQEARPHLVRGLRLCRKFGATHQGDGPRAAEHAGPSPAPQFSVVEALFRLQLLPVEDVDGKPIETGHEFRRDKPPLVIDISAHSGIEAGQAVADRAAGTDNDDAVDVPCKALGVVAVFAAAVHGIPGDETGHHKGLAGPGRHAQGKPQQPPVPIAGDAPEMPDDRVGAVPHLSQVHNGLDRLALGEERAVARAFSGFPRPVFKQLAGGITRALPAVPAPSADLGAQPVDQAFIAVQTQIVLDRAVRPHGHWLHRQSPPRDDLVDRLLVLDRLPVAVRLVVGARQNWLVMDMFAGGAVLAHVVGSFTRWFLLDGPGVRRRRIPHRTGSSHGPALRFPWRECG